LAFATLVAQLGEAPAVIKSETLLANSRSLRISEAIIDGRQSAQFGRRTLREADLPLCWHAQERMLGFAA
jgi:hypothetical protein